MGIFQRLLAKKEEKKPTAARPEKAENVLDEWEALPEFIPADETDYLSVSLIATAIAAGDRSDSQFKVRKIMQRNPEALRVSIIASALAAEHYPDSRMVVRSIYTKK